MELLDILEASLVAIMNAAIVTTTTTSTTTAATTISTTTIVTATTTAAKLVYDMFRHRNKNLQRA